MLKIEKPSALIEHIWLAYKRIFFFVCVCPLHTYTEKALAPVYSVLMTINFKLNNIINHFGRECKWKVILYRYVYVKIYLIGSVFVGYVYPMEKKESELYWKKAASCVAEHLLAQYVHRVWEIVGICLQKKNHNCYNALFILYPIFCVCRTYVCVSWYQRLCPMPMARITWPVASYKFFTGARREFFFPSEKPAAVDIHAGSIEIDAQLLNIWFHSTPIECCIKCQSITMSPKILICLYIQSCCP